MPAVGLLRVIPGSELPTTDQGSTIPEDATDVSHSELERHIRGAWEKNRNAKLRIEEGLLEDLRAKNGEYHPAKLREIREQGGSELYMMITATKQRAAASWIKDILLPEDDKAWGIGPTPNPELPEWAEQASIQRVQQFGGDASDLAEIREILKTEIDFQAELSAENMERLMEDQLAEAKWGDVISELIDDFTTFSACIMKGPMLKKRKRLKWSQGFGSFSPKITDELVLEYARVSPFDIYPSPESEGINDGDLIEHIRFRRGELYNMLGVPGYRDDEIRGVLTEYEAGKRIWLWNDSERNENENKHHWWRHQRNGLIDGLHYWGSIQGKHLKQWGISVEDELAEYQIDAILIGRYIIRCTINNDPLARRPYQKACYDPIPGGFWGNSIRYLMADIQELCNATARALVNNMAMASGPQVEVNYERLSPLENELEMYPWKIWQTRGSEVGGSPVMQFFQPESNAQELMAVYENFERKADDTTMIPRYTYGNENVGGAGQTASGLSMLLSSAAKGIKSAIGSFDRGITQPALEHQYFYNMMTSNDPGVKGDSQVVARGAKELLLRDLAAARRNEFLAMTANPIDMSIIGKEGRADMLRHTAKDYNMDGVVPGRDRVRAMVKAEMENPPPNPELLKIQSEAESKERDRQMNYDLEMQKLEMEKGQGGVEQAKIYAQRDVDLAKEATRKDTELAKIAANEASNTRQMQEETARIRERNVLNQQTDEVKHERDMEYQREKDRLQRESDERKHAREMELKAKEQSESETEDSQNGNEGSSEGNAQPMVLNVQIDNAGGKTKKTIEVMRDGAGRTKTLEVSEEAS